MSLQTALTLSLDCFVCYVKTRWRSIFKNKLAKIEAMRRKTQNSKKYWIRFIHSAKLTFIFILLKIIDWIMMMWYTLQPCTFPAQCSTRSLGLNNKCFPLPSILKSWNYESYKLFSVISSEKILVSKVGKLWLYSSRCLYDSDENFQKQRKE